MESESLKTVSCKICFDLFGEDLKCPRILPCGHCFCHSCIKTLLESSSICPLCRKRFKPKIIQEFPICFPVLDFLQEHKNSVTEKRKENSNNCVLLEDGFCKEHNSPVQFRCMDCANWACGTCAMLQHKECRTLLLRHAFEEMHIEEVEELNKFRNDKKLDKTLEIAQNGITKCQQEIENLQLNLENKNNRLKDLQQYSIELLNNKEKIDQISTEIEEKLPDFVSSSQYETVKSKLGRNLEIAKSNIQDFIQIEKKLALSIDYETLSYWLEGEASIQVVEKSEKETLFGLLGVKNGTIRINSFVSEQPPHSSILISFRDLLSSLTGSSELPGKAFFQFQELDGEVIVKTDDDLAASPRVLNFLYLTSGLKGPTYENKTVDRGTWQASISCPWMKNDEEVWDAVVDEITDGGIYEAPFRRGSVYGRKIASGSLSKVGFCLKDLVRGPLETKFGHIESGIEVLDQVKGGIDSVQNCGLVIG